ncbi:transcriptional regulator [Methylobacterium oxalidis]|uniref:Uncharacterized protein n=1 Tax=Methylobacterium oxalidis TaxID=944322 RepID=A0A512JDF8_9HYPH|nr:transcriptional regulator [Methylobacterium oxalidis]GEP07990.1 hypothetical protein MOX02_60280 [Methylobacterium oxalidis]GJE35926.1 hypothetical protein LDDCCGHA_6147 [Methylobacterium oxalidis]GLS62528.1 hypothetical protein GCM10007888_09090 [Methylobacterium oxalidis]
MTGTQIVASRRLLRWDQRTLANAAQLRLSVIMRAESAPGVPDISAVQADAIRSTLENAGIVFTINDPGVKLQGASASSAATFVAQ